LKELVLKAVEEAKKEFIHFGAKKYALPPTQLEDIRKRVKENFMSSIYVYCTIILIGVLIAICKVPMVFVPLLIGGILFGLFTYYKEQETFKKVLEKSHICSCDVLEIITYIVGLSVLFTTTSHCVLILFYVLSAIIVIHCAVYNGEDEKLLKKIEDFFKKSGEKKVEPKVETKTEEKPKTEEPVVEEPPKEQTSFKIEIVSAKNIPVADLNGLSDPFVKVKYYSKGEKKSDIKTDAKKQTLEPVWNYKFEANDVDEKGISFSIYDEDKVTDNEKIGKLKLPLKKLQENVGKETEFDFEVKKGQVKEGQPSIKIAIN